MKKYTTPYTSAHFLLLVNDERFQIIKKIRENNFDEDLKGICDNFRVFYLCDFYYKL